MSAAYVLFDFLDDRLTDHSRVLTLMHGLVENGWRFLKKPLVCDDIPGDDLKVPPTPEYTEKAWNNAIRAHARNQSGYWMDFQNIDDLKFSFGYDPRKSHRLLLATDTSLLRRRDQTPNMRALVSVTEQIYDALKPDYGYGLFSYDIHSPAEPDAALRAVWDINVYSPAMVERLGRDTLKYLPAWRAHSFDDGGLLLEMAANPIAEASSYAQYYKHAATTLGVPYHQAVNL